MSREDSDIAPIYIIKDVKDASFKNTPADIKILSGEEKRQCHLELLSAVATIFIGKALGN